MLKLQNEPIKIDNDSYEIRLEDKRVKVDGIRLPGIRIPLADYDAPISLPQFNPLDPPVVVKEEQVVSKTSDAIHLSGPDANVEREQFLAEQVRAENVDGSKITEILREVFVDAPAKTLDEMSDEEALTHFYKLEESVRLLRIHLLSRDRNIRKRRERAGKQVFDALDKNFKPKPIPESRKANDKEYKLACNMAEQMEISVEKALEILRAK